MQGRLLRLCRRLHRAQGEDAVDHEALLEVLTDFRPTISRSIGKASSAPNEALVNALAMMSPYGPAEKQAMLEAPDSRRAQKS
jgi:Lon protease-like protein